MNLSKPYLISSADLSLRDLKLIFEKAKYFGDAPNGTIFDDLKNTSVCTMFLEPSTRTKISFELAAKRLSAITVDFDLASTSYVKGESLLDTIHTLESMGIEYFISRNTDFGTAKYFAENSKSKILNAGEGSQDHPSQGLLDAYTLIERIGSLEQLKGKKICLVGDIKNSRVAKSNFNILSKLGLEISTCSPLEFQLPDSKFKNYENIEQALRDNDIMMMLRIQRERSETFNKFDFTKQESLEWYRDNFALTKDRAIAYPEKLIMHPGPANFGIEIDKEVESLQNSLIKQQVRNGVLIRMAILSLLSRASRKNG
ncbi:aspartate carbamoyltransferase catalytic subunit [Candidatus Kapabacteria bacterium]|nr:aspartate carbamoyltransferase catalytic subunit [Candidatus Kapabacteria bacterium]